MDDTIFDDWDLDDEAPEPTTPPARRVPWMLLIGAVPWLVVAGLLLGPSRPGPASAQVSGAVASESEVADGPAAAEPVEAGAVAPATTARVLAAPTAAVPTAATVGAVAVVVARAHLTDVGPRLAVEGVDSAGGDRYVEHVALESVEHPGPGAAVATVTAVVLTVHDGEYAGVQVERLAVPLIVDGSGVSPAGTPWPLPPRDLTPRSLTVGEPITDPVLLTEAADALTAAGYAVDAVTSLTATASWPLLVSAEGTAPGHATPGPLRVWLRSHLGELVVAGARPPEAQP